MQQHPPSISVSYFPSTNNLHPGEDPLLSIPIKGENSPPTGFDMEGTFDDLSLDQQWTNADRNALFAVDPLPNDFFFESKPTKKAGAPTSRSAPIFTTPTAPISPNLQQFVPHTNQTHIPMTQYSPSYSPYIQIQPKTSPNSTGNFRLQQLDEFNAIEANELNLGNSFRKWTPEEHSKFLVSYQTYQHVSGEQRWKYMSKYIHTRNPQEVRFHTSIYDFHGTSLAKEVSGAIVDLYEFTSMKWTVEEQQFLEIELRREPIGANILHSYFALAAKFPNKSVRDIAFRLRWMKQNKDKHLSPSPHSYQQTYQDVSPPPPTSSYPRRSEEFRNAVFSNRNDRSKPPINPSNPMRPMMRSSVDVPLQRSTMFHSEGNQISDGCRMRSSMETPLLELLDEPRSWANTGPIPVDYQQQNQFSFSTEGMATRRTVNPMENVKYPSSGGPFYL